MNSKALMGLVIGAAAAVGVAIWATQSRAPARHATPATSFLPGLSANLNELQKIEVEKDGAVVTLVRGSERWGVEEKNEHPADIAQVRELLIGLADARILEQKTSNPDNYARLGVADIDAEDGAGVGVTIGGAAETRLILGKSARGGQARYLRRAGEAASWLVSGDFDLPPADPLQWLDKDVMDIAGRDVQAVTIVHPDGASVNAEKPDRDATNIEVNDLPKGRELAAPGSGNSMANVMQKLRFDDVLPAAGFEFAPDATVTTTYRTFDGLAVVARVLARDEEYFANFAVSFDQPQAERFAIAQAAAGGDSDPATDTAATAAEAAEFSAAQTRAATLNGRLENWVYRLPKFKYDQMTRRMDDLLKPVE